MRRRAIYGLSARASKTLPSASAYIWPKNHKATDGYPEDYFKMSNIPIVARAAEVAGISFASVCTGTTLLNTNVRWPVGVCLPLHPLGPTLPRSSQLMRCSSVQASSSPAPPVSSLRSSRIRRPPRCSCANGGRALMSASSFPRAARCWRPSRGSTPRVLTRCPRRHDCTGRRPWRFWGSTRGQRWWYVQLSPVTATSFTWCHFAVNQA